jgi:hypothetical protein
MQAAQAANMIGIIANYGYLDPASSTADWPAAGSVLTPFALMRYLIL